MRALTYQVNPLGWATCKWLHVLWPGCLVSAMNGLRLKQMDPPALPDGNWVRVRTLMAGICGTDTAIFAQKQRANSILQAFSSTPCVLGHENVAVVEEVSEGVSTDWIGRRVCVEPSLNCTVRGIDPPCHACAKGIFSACENFADDGGGRSQLPVGTAIGYNRRTGGAFSEGFVAHESQLVAVPDSLTDEQAVLTDPLACSLHAALRSEAVGRTERVLVYGTGMLGLGVVGALRAIGYEGRIDALDRCDALAERAVGMGADQYVQLPAKSRARFERVAELTGATVQRARFGNYMLSGGYDVIFDCVASRQSMTESLRWTRSRGRVVFVGTGDGMGADLTPIWFRELSLVGAYGRQIERLDGREVNTYTLVHEMLTQGKLKTDGLLTHTFPLADYRQAFTMTLHKAAHGAMKVAFDFR